MKKTWASQVKRKAESACRNSIRGAHGQRTVSGRTGKIKVQQEQRLEVVKELGFWSLPVTG
jgi:hypothetical protein